MDERDDYTDADLPPMLDLASGWPSILSAGIVVGGVAFLMWYYNLV